MKKLTILLFIILIPSCSSVKTTYKTENYSFKNEYLNVNRSVEKIREGILITLEINSNIKLKGYFTISEQFSRPVHLVMDSKCLYKPYFESNNEIRFVFSDPDKTDNPDFAVSIPKSSKFKVSYIVMDKNNKKDLTINGRILYLVNNKPVPELKIITEIK